MCENGMVGKYVCSWWVCAKLSMISVTHFSSNSEKQKGKTNMENINNC